MNTELRFPIFAFQKNDDMVYVFFNEHTLKSTNTEILDKIGYAGITLIESTGSRGKASVLISVATLGL